MSNVTQSQVAPMSHDDAIILWQTYGLSELLNYLGCQGGTWAMALEALVSLGGSYVSVKKEIDDRLVGDSDV